MGSAVLAGALESKGQKGSFDVEKQSLTNTVGMGERCLKENFRNITLLVSPTGIKGQLLNCLLSGVLF